MAELVIFPDAEAWACQYLSERLGQISETYTADVYVSNEVPTTRAPRMVIVRRDGGQRLDVAREVARLGVRVFAPSDEEVSDLTQMVRALLAASVGEGPVRRYVEIAGPARILEASRHPVRFFTVELTVRGTSYG